MTFYALHIASSLLYPICVMAIDYRAWLEAAKSELADLQRLKDSLRYQQDQLRQQEQEVDKKIAAVAQTVGALAQVVPDAPSDPSLTNILIAVGKVFAEAGMTDRVRVILQAAAPQGLSAIEIRSQLEAGGFSLGTYSNALATIYTVVRRLVGAGQVIEHDTGDGKRFRWNGPVSLKSLARAGRAK